MSATNDSQHPATQFPFGPTEISCDIEEILESIRDELATANEIAEKALRLKAISLLWKANLSVDPEDMSTTGSVSDSAFVRAVAQGKKEEDR